MVTLSSPKGGCGKSTTALILATTLAELGASVTLLDCDGNQPLVRWKAGATRSRVKVLSAVSEREILPVIDRERASTGLVVIDIEGAATRLASRAVMRADLVLVPARPRLSTRTRPLGRSSSCRRRRLPSAAGSRCRFPSIGP